MTLSEEAFSLIIMASITSEMNASNFLTMNKELCLLGKTPSRRLQSDPKIKNF